MRKQKKKKKNTFGIRQLQNQVGKAKSSFVAQPKSIYCGHIRQMKLLQMHLQTAESTDAKVNNPSCAILSFSNKY